ncbi:MAG TPA: SWIM zinc finger family protein [Anaerolineae bacterium]|nr:SWIM zinc finger family protein [Anaerolineae bacterium]
MAKRRQSYYEGYWPSYEVTRPIDVEDGIKARSQSGKFVKNWWADRWIAALTPLMDSARLTRGRGYARRGQVIDIKVQPGQVASRVQGSRPAPYRVKIEVKPLTDRQWETVLDALAGQAIFAAQLLNGEMPPDVEEVFRAVKVPLFPASKGDLKTDCSCPDWANPCKHIAAVYYLLGERFDEDPFLLFELRGRSKAEIVEALRERRAAEMVVAQPPAAHEEIEPLDVPALGECLGHFWTMGEQAEGMAFRVDYPEPAYGLLKRAGVPAFEGMDARGFRMQMQRVYDGVSDQARQAAFAEREENADPQD